MLSNEERNKLIEAHKKGYKSKDLAEIFKITPNSVNRIVRQEKNTESYELKTDNSVRMPILTEEDLKNISYLIDLQPDITINEIIENLKLNAVNETVRKAVKKRGMYIRKNLCTPLSVNVPDVAEKRKDWIEKIKSFDKSHLVFLMKVA